MIAKPPKAVRIGTLVILMAGILVATGCGHYPSGITSLRDINHTSPREYHIVLSSDVPLQDLRSLAKFKGLYEIDIDRGGTDEHLAALAGIGFTNLAEIVLTDSPGVTDKGLMSLVRIPTLIGLGLRGTSIDDAGCRLIAKQMKLQDINLPNCPQVTVSGLLALAQSETIQDLGFSLNDLTQADLLKILRAAHGINHIEIAIGDEADRKLDLLDLRRIAEAKGIVLLGIRHNLATPL